MIKYNENGVRIDQVVKNGPCAPKDAEQYLKEYSKEGLQDLLQKVNHDISYFEHKLDKSSSICKLGSFMGTYAGIGCGLLTIKEVFTAGTTEMIALLLGMTGMSIYVAETFFYYMEKNEEKITLLKERRGALEQRLLEESTMTR